MVVRIKKPSKKHIVIMVKIAVAIGLLAFVASKQDWANLKKVFAGLDILVFVAGLLLFLLCQIIVAVRWYVLLRVQSIDIGIIAAIKLNFLGLFYNNFLPSSVGGDFARAWYVTKHTDKKLEAVFSVFVDRAVGLITLTIIAIVGYYALIRPMNLQMPAGEADSSTTAFSFAGYWFAALAVLAVGLILFVAALFFRRTRDLLKKFAGLFISKFLRAIDAVKLCMSRPLMLLLAFAMTFVAQSITIVGFWLIGENLGIGLDLRYYFVFFPVSWAVGTVPISIGGIGVVEGLLTVLFVKFGGLQEAAFALSLCQRLIFLLIALPGVVIHLTSAHLPTAEEFFVDGKEILN